MFISSVEMCFYAIFSVNSKPTRPYCFVLSEASDVLEVSCSLDCSVRVMNECPTFSLFPHSPRLKDYRLD